jgi:hypothetical protein
MVHRSALSPDGKWVLAVEMDANGGNDAACCPLMVLRKASLLGRTCYAA